MWKRMPHVMIAKVAEALALRKCFPWDPTRGIGIGSDVYTTEEMEQADRPPAVTVSVQERIMAKAAGITVREFADAVRELDAATIRAIRDEMFPGVVSVNNLNGTAAASPAGQIAGTAAVGRNHRSGRGHGS